MNPETLGQLILAAFAAATVACILWSALRCRGGLGIWFLSVTARVYGGLMFRCRANPCPVPLHGPALVIANHRSPIDPILLWHGYLQKVSLRNARPIGFMMAKEFNIWPFSLAFSALRTILVARDGADIGPSKEALRHLKDGELVGVFPEGRLNLGEGLLPANPGIAWLALRAKVPVYPAYIAGAPQGTRFIHPFYTLSRVRVTYGEPIDLSAHYGEKKTQELLLEVSEAMMQRVAKLAPR